MGTVIFPETDLPIPPWNKIHTTNWRTLADLGDNKIEVVLARCDRFVINMSMNEFYAMNENKQAIVTKFKYINSTISCTVCQGKGKVDWIQKIRPNSEVSYDDSHISKYRRNKDMVNIFHTASVDTIYGSTPHLQEGFDICPMCKGTGLHLMRYAEMESEQK